MNQDDILRFINESRDSSFLATLVEAIEARLETLDKMKEAVHVLPHRGYWYAVHFLDDKTRRRATRLDHRLTPEQALKIVNHPKPNALDFKLEPDVADRERQKNPSAVGWVELDADNSKHYYLVAPYLEARSKWFERQKIVTDPRLLAYGLTIRSMAYLQKLEADGHEIIFSKGMSPAVGETEGSSEADTLPMGPVTTTQPLDEDLTPEQLLAMMVSYRGSGVRVEDVM